MPIPKEDIKKAIVAGLHVTLRDWITSPLPEYFRRYIHIEDGGNTIEIGEGSDSMKVFIK